MTTLDKVIQLQQRGSSDTEIMAQLQNEGISPSEINNSINQAKIKNAVSPREESEIETNPKTPTAEMQPSLMSNPATPLQPPIQQYAQEDTLPTQDQYYTPQPQTYQEQEYMPQQENYEIETISEIAEQVATEKIEDYKAKVGDIASFKLQIQDKVNDIDDRLKRIENSIDNLQQSVIGRIGEFGESSSIIHKDLDNLHDTVSKLMNPLIDNINEMKKTSK